MARPPTRPIEGSFSRAEIQQRYRTRKLAERTLAALARGVVPQQARRGRPPRPGAITFGPAGSNPVQPPPADAAPRTICTQTAIAPPPVAVAENTNGDIAAPLDPVAADHATRLSRYVREQRFREFTQLNRARDLITRVLIAANGTMTESEVATLCEADIAKVMEFLRAQGLVIGDANRVMAVQNARSEFDFRLANNGRSSAAFDRFINPPGGN